MSTLELTVRDYSGSDSYLKVTLTYSTSYDATKHQLSLQSISLRAYGSAWFHGKVYVAYDGVDVWAKTNHSGDIISTGSSNAVSYQINQTVNTSLAASTTKPLVIRWTMSGSAKISISISIPARQYTNTYYPNGGSGSSQTQPHNYGAPFTTMTASAFTKQNYSLAGWNTASTGTGTNYSLNTAYTVNSDLSLYAKWTQVYASPQLAVSKSYRCNANGVMNDEGTSVRVVGTVKIWKTGDETENTLSTMSASVNGVTSSQAVTSFTSSGNWLSMPFDITVNASLSTEQKYTLRLTATDIKGATTTTNTAKSYRTTTKDIVIQSVFCTIDVLGDGYLYVLSSDTSVASGKTYYQLVDEQYVEVEDPSGNPSQQGWYVATGPKPGHGIAFGSTCTSEGMHIAMPTYVEDNNLNLVRGDLYTSSATSYSAAPSAPTDGQANNNIYTNSILSYDSLGNQVGYMQVVNYNNGTTSGVYRSFAAKNPRTSNVMALYLYSRDDGTCYPSLNTGYWGIAYGGTGMTGVTSIAHASASTVITMSSGYTLSDSAFRIWGKVMMLRLTVAHSAAISVPASGNIDDLTIATIKSGYRPAIDTAWTSHGDNAGTALGYISSAGSVVIGAFEGTGSARSIATDKNINVFAVYLLP